MTKLTFALSRHPASTATRTALIESRFLFASLSFALFLLTLFLITFFLITWSPASHASNTAANDSAANETASADVDAKANNGKKAAPSIEEILADRQFTQGEVVRQIRTHTIDTWRYLDRHHIYIDGIGKNNNYLVEFHHSCREARGGESLLYKTHNGNLTKFDTIQIVDTLGGGHSLQPRRSCAIKEIYRLERIQENAAEGADSDNPVKSTTVMTS